MLGNGSLSQIPKARDRLSGSKSVSSMSIAKVSRLVAQTA